MITIGGSWLAYWLLVDIFAVDSLKAALSVAITYIIIGLVLGERPANKG